ncbi:MAG: tetratricopeptide repeat protein [bacterium]
MISRFSAIFAFVFILSSGLAFSGDPSEFFVKAFQDYQAGEQLERDGRLRDAMKAYASTVSILEQIRKDDPSWQEIVVNFRMRKAKENIERLRSIVASEPEKLPPTVDPLPTRGFEIDIPDPALGARRSRSPASAGQAASVSAATREQIASLERQLAEYRKLNAEEKRSRERLEGEIGSVKMELEKTKTELVATTSRLAQSEDAGRRASAERDDLRKKLGEPQDKKIEKLSERIARLEAENDVARDENTRLLGKLERAASYIAASKKVLTATDEDRRDVAAQRDKALARIKRLKDNDAELANIKKDNASLQTQIASQKDEMDRLAEVDRANKDLAQKLAESEKKLAQVADAGGISRPEAEGLREEIVQLQDRLSSARQELASRDTKVKTLMAQLDEATGEFAKLRLNAEPSEEQKRLLAENQLLREIVTRQIHEQGERRQIVSDLEKELERLQVQSGSLASSIASLSNPPPVLKDEEHALFREPIPALPKPEDEGAGLSLTAVKPSKTSSATESSIEESGGLDDASKQVAAEAASFFTARRYDEAEKKYQRIVDLFPKSHFALANLGVTQIQTGKISAAQVALEKALSLKSDDGFTLLNLSKVYCRQGRFDDAISLLNRALAADSQNAVAHNYLAIALGNKGETAKAEESFQKSLALDPKYASAHFNLAVLYANSTPPAMQLAREHYETAKALGAEPDPVLERRLAVLQLSN